MFPADLKPEQFGGYPPEARKLAIEYLGVFQRLPLSFLPNLLREVIDYDYRFPAERKTLEKELANLHSLSGPEPKEWFREFAGIQLSAKLEQFDWINSPSQFVEQLSSHLWTTHQLDAFRKAATDYADRLHAAVRPDPPALPRLGIAVIGQGVDTHEEPLFRRLRPHGAYFTAIQPDNGLQRLLDVVAARAKSTPLPYAHWYIDGGQEIPHPPAITCVSYKNLEPARAALLREYKQKPQRRAQGRRRYAR